MAEEKEKKDQPSAEDKKVIKENNINLIMAIVLAAIIIGGAIVYASTRGGNLFGLRETDEKLDERVAASIERYIKKQEEEMLEKQKEANKPKKVEGVSADNDAVLGDKDAPVTIVEFSDYECPFCKRHFETVLPKLKEKYIDTGKVKYIFRDMPLPFHDPLATQEAMAAECAKEQGGDQAYYRYHDSLYKNTNSNGNGMPKSDLYKLAKETGLDSAKFKNCLDSEKFADEVKKDAEDGAKYGVEGTPGFFVNGWFIKGAYPYEAFEELIEQELEKK